MLKKGRESLLYIHDLCRKILVKLIIYHKKALLVKGKSLKDPVYYFQRSLRIYLIPKVVVQEEERKDDLDGLATPIEYCISLNVITQEWQEGEFTLLTSASEVCPQVASCGLPAVHLPDKHLCITGLCSVLRHLVAQLSPHQSLLGN